MTVPPLIGINCDSFQDRFGPISGIRDGYWESVVRAGGLPVLIPHCPDAGQLKTILERLDGVLLTGGDDLRPERLGQAAGQNIVPISSERDRTDFLLIEALLDRQIPTLAICLGLQELNIHCGGTIWQDLASEYPESAVHHRGEGPYRYVEHPIAINPSSRLGWLWGGKAELMVTSAHHQAIRDLAPNLEAVAWAPDGLVEAAEVPDHPFFVGVQWHPERISAEDPHQMRLFEALVEAASRRFDHG